MTTQNAQTTKGFPIHTEESAPDAAGLLARSTEAYGFVPNLHGILAEAPKALDGYQRLFALFGETSFTPAEQQVVYLTANRENECRYCMAGHSVMAKSAGLGAAAIAALRDGRALTDPRLDALRRFTSLVVTQRGWVGEDAVAAFLEAGFTRQQVLEVVLGVATKVISTYANHLADTPLDGFMKDNVWAPTEKRAAA